MTLRIWLRLPPTNMPVSKSLCRRFWIILLICVFCGIAILLFSGTHENMLFPMGILDRQIRLRNRTRRILCLIVTMPKSHDSKAMAVKRTWAKRCDAYVFISSTEDKNLPSLGGKPEEHRMMKLPNEIELALVQMFLRKRALTFEVISTTLYLAHADRVTFSLGQWITGKKQWSHTVSRQDNHDRLKENNTAGTFHSWSATTGEGRHRLWEKTKFALQFALKNYLHFEFFLKADDDTYMVMENLRAIVNDKSPETPLIMGRRFKPNVIQGFLCGGSGYIMSRAGLKLITDGLKNVPRCAGNVSGGDEDIRIGICAEATGVKVIDSLDSLGLERFHPMSAYKMLNEANNVRPRWYPKYNYHPIQSGERCCSVDTISFHYVSPGDIYLYEFFIYRLRVWPG